MKHQIKNSSSIAAIEETENGTLIIEFINGDSYEYFGVADYVVIELLQAPSTGRYFNENIRGQYEEKLV